MKKIKNKKPKDPLKANYFKLNLVPEELKSARKKSYAFFGLAIIFMLIAVVFIALSGAAYKEILDSETSDQQKLEFIRKVSSTGLFSLVEPSIDEINTIDLEITPLFNQAVGDVRIALGVTSITSFVLAIIFTITSYMYFLGSVKIPETNMNTNNIPINKNL
ncbi:hypothetical protein [Mycoplasma sp. E35C]|uniref:hypothetical protein n=1 Tax=Mycoplasma sp. E35C TaxID=2801918 RepID=UPI001CA3F3C9|nr:hypothetical protein [Mycoplasma sp. E35C]QZX49256.1 hypothetical protein JJE79_00615 [Mycoplasma sp. E35C]